MPKYFVLYFANAVETDRAGAWTALETWATVRVETEEGAVMVQRNLNEVEFVREEDGQILGRCCYLGAERTLDHAVELCSANGGNCGGCPNEASCDGLQADLCLGS